MHQCAGTLLIPDKPDAAALVDTINDINNAIASKIHRSNDVWHRNWKKIIIYSNFPTHTHHSRTLNSNTNCETVNALIDVWRGPASKVHEIQPVLTSSTYQYPGIQFHWTMVHNFIHSCIRESKTRDEKIEENCLEKKFGAHFVTFEKNQKKASNVYSILILETDDLMCDFLKFWTSSEKSGKKTREDDSFALVSIRYFGCPIFHRWIVHHSSLRGSIEQKTETQFAGTQLKLNIKQTLVECKYCFSAMAKWQ